MSPEVVSGKDYNEKCDIWSCGVLLYLMVSGFPPFYGQTRDEIVSLIKNGCIYFSGTLANFDVMIDPVWKQVSSECKMFITNLMKYDAEDRLTASAALRSPWIRKFDSVSVVSDVELRITLNNLKNYRSHMLFQKVVLNYIASRQLSQNSEMKIKRLFDFYDTDGDGQISKSELIAGYKLICSNAKKACKEAEDILSHITLNKNGNIGYNGVIRD